MTNEHTHTLELQLFLSSLALQLFSCSGSDMALIVLISLLHFYLLCHAGLCLPSCSTGRCNVRHVSEWLIYMRYLS